MLAVDLAIALHGRGVESSVLGLSGGGRLEARLRDAGVPFHLVGDSRYLSPATHWAVGRALRRLRPTVVHSHHLPALLNAGPAARFACGARVVHTEHAHIYLDEQPRARTLLRFAVRMADVVTLVGAALQPYYADVVGIPTSRLRVVVNGVDTARFRSVPPEQVRARRRAAGLPECGVLVGAVGRIAAVKNYPLLLRAVADARVDGVPVKAVVVGDGEDRASVEALAAELALGDGATFLGWRTDVADLVGLFDVLAVTSLSEALPLVVLEAMSAGVPVVSTAVGEIPRVLGEGEAGILVPLDDAPAFAAALRRLAGDAGVRQALGAAGRARIEREYSQDAMVDAYVGLYGLGTPRRP